ncbi:Acetyl esterase/lipase [Saccharopolyspora kobensis]|uniref:Acetyl esterase/lipase n=1 Tax=Saccharopolyspora kobensis TaxID=146035 RepID=A0A1H6D1R5_9PSEU|nr:alpha/beta hydrolase [Saccharopolyspora kobensis]SEG78556.1 Acetyl esterase/lipase [Saccharopolyspora kobensis]SFD05630.1 Acetyl esterase/lipase [Saccharopolyspora kobensis]
MSATRRVLAACFALLALVAAGCSRVSDADEAPPVATAARDLGAVEVLRDQPYAEHDTGALKLDLFLPEQQGSPAPLVVYVHGGGWDAGVRTLDADRTTTEALTAERLLERGYAVATVDYRLSGVAQAPAQLVDVADAVRWLQQRAGQWDLDGERVVLWGASAGGQLVSQLGAVTGDPDKPGGGLTGIRAVIDWFGPTDMSAEAQRAQPHMQEYARRVVNQLLGCMPVDCPDKAEAISPIRHLSGDEPPFLIQQGTADSLVPLEQSLDFAEALRTLGVTVEMHPYEGLDHGFGRGPHTPLIVDTVTAFVETHV